MNKDWRRCNRLQSWGLGPRRDGESPKQAKYCACCRNCQPCPGINSTPTGGRLCQVTASQPCLRYSNGPGQSNARWNPGLRARPTTGKGHSQSTRLNSWQKKQPARCVSKPHQPRYFRGCFFIAFSDTVPWDPAEEWSPPPSQSVHIENPVGQSGSHRRSLMIWIGKAGVRTAKVVANRVETDHITVLLEPLAEPVGQPEQSRLNPPFRLSPESSIISS